MIYFVIGAILLGLYNPLLGLAVLLIPLARDFTREKRIIAIESELPLFIYHVAAQKPYTLRDVIFLGTSGFGELSREMKKVWRMVEEGLSPERALEEYVSSAPSGTIKRTFAVLLTAYKTGKKDVLQKLAEELFDVQDIIRERLGLLALQRYSIFFSSSVLVPFILGTAFSVAKNLGGNVSLPVLPYLVMLSLISGIYLGLVEGRPKNTMFYAVLGALLSLTIYSVVPWLS